MLEILTNFHFVRPYLLLSMLPACLLFLSLLRQQQRSGQWQSLIAPHLLPHLMEGTTSKASRLPLIAILVAWLIASLAIAGPTWEQQALPVKKKVSALVVLWDLSPSMNAQDVKPSRVVRSRLKLMDLLNQRDEGLTGLVSYAGEAYVVTPLTDDIETIASLLPGLNPNIMPVRGSNPEMALELANKILKDAGIDQGDILFVTDGIDPSALNELASLSEGTQHRTLVWGIGTREGAPIPINGGGFARNNNSEIVVAKLNDNELSEAASEMNGIYIPFTLDDFDIRTITGFSESEISSGMRESMRQFDQWVEKGHYLILLILPIAALAFRRGWLLTISIMFINLAPNASYAFEWQDLWKTQNQQAQTALEQGDTSQAAELFEHPQWKGVAQHRNKDYETAAESFSKGDSYSDYYNKGTALTHLGKYDEAIQSFDEALKRKPDFEEAENNRRIAQSLKTLQENQQQNADQQRSDQQSSDQNSSDQQDSKQQNSEQQNSQEQSSSQQSEPNQQSNSEQNSSQEQRSEQNSSNQQQTDQQQASENQNSHSLSDEQQEALEEKYNSKDKQQDQNGEGTEEEHLTQRDQAENQEENAEQAMYTQDQDKENQEPEANDEQAITEAAQILNRKQNEKQQALEQWLRKVPDDPSGLLRNKFKYETNERRKAIRSGKLRSPNGRSTERW